MFSADALAFPPEFFFRKNRMRLRASTLAKTLDVSGLSMEVARRAGLRTSIEISGDLGSVLSIPQSEDGSSQLALLHAR